MNIRNFGFTSNQMKIAAAAFMVCDHIAFFLLPYGTPAYMVLRRIGRLAFPMFAYFVAEGCKYSRNRVRYLLTMLGCAAIAEVVFAVATGTGALSVNYFSIFTTFSLGIAAVYIYDFFVADLQKRRYAEAALCGGALIAFMLAVYLIDAEWRNIEYGVGGVLIVLLVYALKYRLLKPVGVATGAGVTVLTGILSGLQIYSIIAAPVMLLYNGKRGKLKMKYFFYIFYPAHVVAILLAGMAAGLI